MTAKPIEIVLFYIDDKEKKIENVLGIFKTVNKLISPNEMLKMCVWSIKNTMPSAQITLFTDENTDIHESVDDISVVRFNDIQHDRLMFDLQRIRKEYLYKNLINGVDKHYIFTDIDVLFNKSMEHVFLEDFHIASPATFHDQKYSPRGIPYESLMSIINGGLWFVKTDIKVIEFYDRWLAVMLDLAATDDLSEYGKAAPTIKRDFLKWWGEPHSLMVMFAKEFASGERNLINYHGTLFRIFEENLYNYAPDIITDSSGSKTLKLTNQDFMHKYLFHFRGGRKLFMRAFAPHIGYPKQS